jgi:hypothetical protein
MKKNKLTIVELIGIIYLITYLILNFKYSFSWIENLVFFGILIISFLGLKESMNIQ